MDEKSEREKQRERDRIRLAVRARRLVQARYGENCEEELTKAEYSRLLKAAQQEVMAVNKEQDPRVQVKLTRKADPARHVKKNMATQKRTLAEPQNHRSRKALTASVKDCILQTYNNMGGVEGYTRWAEKNPTLFYDHWAKLLPLEIKATMEINTNITSLLEQARLRVANLNRDPIEGEATRVE